RNLITRKKQERSTNTSMARIKGLGQSVLSVWTFNRRSVLATISKGMPISAAMLALIGILLVIVAMAFGWYDRTSRFPAVQCK
ncbi:hypothetical protein, partial [Ruegeria haliotis]|uniref:hypothetical protein n=1 Tax=Ruegeria haliotis TaxID=2747601 RepID=UPI001B7D8D87